MPENNLSIIEEWRDVDGWSAYEVSNTGHVRRKSTSRVLRAATVNRYLAVVLHQEHRRRMIKVHRLVAIAFLGQPPPDKPEVNHLDGVKSHNTFNNLEWTDRAGNAQHAARMGLFANCPAPPIRRGCKVLTASQIDKIRASNLSGKRLARIFSVSDGTIYNVRNGVVNAATS